MRTGEQLRLKLFKAMSPEAQKYAISMVESEITAFQAVAEMWNEHIAYRCLSPAKQWRYGGPISPTE